MGVAALQPCPPWNVYVFKTWHGPRFVILTCVVLAAFIEGLDTVVTFVVRSGPGEDKRILQAGAPR
jgi:hypothetical protein